jgi:hypothetical protein
MNPDPELLEELRAARILGRDSARVRLIGAALMLVSVTAFWLFNEAMFVPGWVGNVIFGSIVWAPPIAATGLMWLVIGQIRHVNCVRRRRGAWRPLDGRPLTLNGTGDLSVQGYRWDGTRHC